MGVEEHFMALAGIGHDPEGAAGAELDVGDFETSAKAPMKVYSQLQSNWKASPRAKVSGT